MIQADDDLNHWEAGDLPQAETVALLKRRRQEQREERSSMATAPRWPACWTRLKIFPTAGHSCSARSFATSRALRVVAHLR